MGIFQKKEPMEQEWELLLKKESRFLASRAQKKESQVNKKLDAIIPSKLQDALNHAFFKAFGLIFEKGTGVIEKTYNKDMLEKEFQIDQYAEELRRDRKSLKKFSQKARKSSGKNLLFSGVSGIGMGVLGIGLPDIPVFLGMVLKAVYEIALHYGYRYDTEEEQCFILLLIQGAMAWGDDMVAVNDMANAYIQTGTHEESYDRESLILETSALLSKELLYMKFLQGVPLVGAVGGAFDTIYMKQITEYAELKYRRRFLTERRMRECREKR